MDIFSISLLIIIFNINLSQANNIIQIPTGEGSFTNILTKHGYINYEFHKGYIPVRWPVPFIIYNLEGIKNLSLVNKNFIDLKSGDTFEICGLNKDKLNMIFEGPEHDACNDYLCQIFYKTHYIDKMIYSIGSNEKNEFYKFFGGMPENLTNSLNKFTFSNEKDKLSEINFELINGNNLTLNINEDILFQIDDDMDTFFCLPHNIFDTFKELLLKDAEEIYNLPVYGIYPTAKIYRLNETQKNLFPKSISFKIGNKNIILKKNQLISFDNIYNIYIKNSLFLLHINSDSCSFEKIIFGNKFLKLFNFYEKDLELDEYNLYLNKNSEDIIEGKGRKNIILKSDSKIQINIIIFIFIVCTITLVVFRQYHRNKVIESYNYYLEI